MKYKPDPGAKVYRAALGNLTDIAGDREIIEIAEGAAQAAPDRKGARVVGPPPRDAVMVWTDGACTGNPGPMGIGVVVIAADGRRQEVSEYLGEGTNNIAELTAIERGLEVAEGVVGASGVKEKPVLVHTDSSYAIGLLSQGWKAKANQELVQRLRGRVGRFGRISFVKVAGHAGVPENERCDQLATEAAKRRR